VLLAGASTLWRGIETGAGLLKSMVFHAKNVVAKTMLFNKPCLSAVIFGH
jgi:hypothetical protein